VETPEANFFLKLPSQTWLLSDLKLLLHIISLSNLVLRFSLKVHSQTWFQDFIY